MLDQVLIATIATAVAYSTWDKLGALIYVLVALQAETMLQWLMVTLTFLAMSLVSEIGRSMTR